MEDRRQSLAMLLPEHVADWDATRSFGSAIDAR